MPKKIKMPLAQSFRFVEDKQLVGVLRVKSDGLLWKTKGAESWLSIGFDTFQEFAKTSGVPVDETD